MLLVELERSEKGRSHVDFHRSHFLSFCRAPGQRLVCYIQIHYTDLYRFFNTLSSFSPFGPVFPVFFINCSFLVLLTTQFIHFQWIISGRIGQISDFSLPPLPLVFGCGILGAFQRYCQRRKEHFVL